MFSVCQPHACYPSIACARYRWGGHCAISHRHHHDDRRRACTIAPENLRGPEPTSKQSVHVDGEVDVLRPLSSTPGLHALRSVSTHGCYQTAIVAVFSRQICLVGALGSQSCKSLSSAYTATLDRPFFYVYILTPPFNSTLSGIVVCLQT